MILRQHDEIKVYLKSKYLREAPRRPQSGRQKLRQPHLQTIHINDFVPEKQRLTEEERSAWSSDPSLFWTSSSCSFLPGENCDKPLLFVFDTTTHIQLTSHGDCLRRRHLAVFWFDCFRRRYPEQKTAFDREYLDLGQHILGSDVENSDERVSMLREQVKAGRKYDMLTRRFGDGILLALPSSIGWST